MVIVEREGLLRDFTELKGLSLKRGYSELSSAIKSHFSKIKPQLKEKICQIIISGICSWFHIK